MQKCLRVSIGNETNWLDATIVRSKILYDHGSVGSQRQRITRFAKVFSSYQNSKIFSVNLERVVAKG